PPARTPSAPALITPLAFWLTVPAETIRTVPAPAETGCARETFPALTSTSPPPLVIPLVSAKLPSAGTDPTVTVPLLTSDTLLPPVVAGKVPTEFGRVSDTFPFAFTPSTSAVIVP